MKQDRAKTIGEAVTAELKQRDAPFKRLRIHKDQMVEDEYSLRICTTSRRLDKVVLDVLAGFGFGVEYLGQSEDIASEHQWLLKGSGDAKGLSPETVERITRRPVQEGV